MKFRTHQVAGLLFALVTTSCGSAPVAPPDTPSVVVADPPPADVIAAPPPDNLPSVLPASVAGLLPRDTEFVLVAQNPRQLLETARWGELRAKYPSVFAPTVKEMMRELGADLLDITSLEQSGLDLAAPAGLAWLHSKAQAGCVFGGLRDPEAFRQWFIERIATAGGKINSTQVGDTTVLRDDDEEDVALLIKDHQFVGIFVDRSKYAPGLISRLARQQPSASLLQDQHFRSFSNAQLLPGHFIGYVGMQSILDHVFEEIRGSHVPVASDINGVVFSIDVPVEGSPTFDSLITTREDSVLNGMLEARADVPLVFQTRVPEPAFVVAGSVAPAPLSRFVDQVLELEGRSDRIRKDIEAELGMTIPQILGAINGEFGLSIRKDDSRDWWDEVILITVGLSNDGGATLVNQLQTKFGAQRKPKVEKQGNHLIIHDDDATRAALKNPSTSGQLPKGLVAPDFLQPNAIAYLRLDAALIMGALFGFSSLEKSVSIAPPTPTQVSASPLNRQMQKLDAQIEKKHAERQRVESETAQSFASRMGSTLLRLTADGSRYRIRGEQAMRASSASTAIDRTFVDLDKAMRETDVVKKELEKLYDERRKLQEKFDKSP